MSHSMRIRKFRKEDAIDASNIIEQGFQLNSPYYSEDSIKEQIEGNSSRQLIEKSKTVHYFVATENDRILGIGGYDDAKVHTLFVDPKHHREGIGKRILERVLSEAKKEGIRAIDTGSTFHAEKFYASFDFKKIKKFTLQGEYSSIAFILMRKRL